ncbi:zinc finger MYM-type protein 1-like [Cynara cardunculus var. scolymus]|uniref:zinc finger MYM-type protein 1-like n=1 Tax=Cynara cardunculus var. scolymus TaxID=59895 RepID=UPI000D629442|nr:zinc finger MYM-type protein 1-like [Cynara cardunculus var. scolymus]
MEKLRERERESIPNRDRIRDQLDEMVDTTLNEFGLGNEFVEKELKSEGIAVECKICGASCDWLLSCFPASSSSVVGWALAPGCFFPARLRAVCRQCGSDAFVTYGFNSWNKTERLGLHVGDINSFYNRAPKKGEDLMSQDRYIVVAFHKQTEKEKNKNRIQLNASIKACRFLLNNALPFRGHDESEMSISKGMFLETLALIGDCNEDVGKVILKNAPKNNQIVSPRTNGGGFTYVDAHGIVKERFFGIVHVTGTSSSILKSAIDTLFAEHGLSLKHVRGQGYDGASNMCSEFNKIKALILNENSSAYYIHCFAHQLQLVVVAVANKHDGVENFFNMLGMVINVVNASCKRKDMLGQSYKDRVQEAIGKCEIDTRTGKYQELSLIRAGDTRWGSHYKTILSLITLFPNVVEVLRYVEEDGDNGFSRTQAIGILAYLKTFDFVIYLHLMFHILEVTDLLSRALQKKDQDILETVALIRGTKQLLQQFRETGFDLLLKKMYSFCEANGIEALDMEDHYSKNGRQRTNITNRHYYKFDIFNTVVDMQIQEFRDRFSEVSIELLKNIAALSPCNSFSQFNVSDLLKLSELYSQDFSHMERIALGKQLNMYYLIVRQDERFANLSGIVELARLLVETKKHKTYPLVYRLLKLALVLPVATATIERCFSAMKIVKSDLRNKFGDEFLNAAMICTIEKEALFAVSDDDVITQ